jgi:hypothetical protein
MNKTAVVSVLVVAGIGVVAYSLWRGEPSASVGPGATQQTPAPSHTPMRAGETARAAAATASTAEAGATATIEPAAAVDDDQNALTGHATHAIGPKYQPSTSPDQPAAEQEPERASLAPALGALNGNLKALLKDAGPDVAAEVAALPGARAAIERLLTDSDPAVREQASAVMKALSAQPQ